ncbi:MAG: hypothetical protein AAFW75_22500, partial [Cyanobacteria bacterium J06636_16]
LGSWSSMHRFLQFYVFNNSQESHKPIFHLKPADGAIGAHIYAVKDVYKDFKTFAQKIADRTGLTLTAESLVGSEQQ